MCQVVRKKDFKVLISEEGKEPVFYKILRRSLDGEWVTPYFHTPVTFGERMLIDDSDKDGYGGLRDLREFTDTERRALISEGFTYKDEFLVTHGEGFHMLSNAMDVNRARELMEWFDRMLNYRGNVFTVVKAKVPAGYEYWYGECVMHGEVFNSVCAKAVEYETI